MLFAALLSVIFCNSTLTAADNSSTGQIIVKNVWIDVPLSQVFRDISVENGIILATCPHVQDPMVSLDAAKGKPLDECLDELISAQGLYIKKKSDKFYLIVCADPTCPSAIETITPEAIYLKYITAKHLRESMPKSLQEYVTSGTRECEAMIYAVPDITEHIKNLIAQLDVPQEQVMLEVLVVDLWEGTSDEFALDWNLMAPNFAFGVNSAGVGGGFNGFGSYTSIAAANLTAFNFQLKALVSENKASIRSRPRVATLNGEKAKIDVSLDEYYTILTDLYGTNLRGELEVIKSGVTLEMVPHIGDNGFITVDLQTEVSDVASRRNNTNNNNVNSEDLPVIRRRKADTHVRVREGDAIVIGGLIESQENTNHGKIPGAGDLPVVGGLFKRKLDTTTKKEVMIFITPQIIRDSETAFADRNKLINTKQEVDKLRSQEYFVQKEVDKRENKKDDINSLKQAIDILGDDKTTVKPAGSIGATSNDQASVERERQMLEEAISLLDPKNSSAGGSGGK